MARSETLESRVARLEEAHANSKEDRLESRAEARADRADILVEIKALAADLKETAGDVRKLDQSVQSANRILADLSLEKCGERLTKHDERLDKLEGTVLTDDFKESTTRLSRLEETVQRWQKWMGTGVNFIVRLALALIAGGAIAGTIGTYLAKVVAHFTG